MLESVFVLTIVFGKIFIGIAALVGLPIYVARIIIRLTRANRWVSSHDGVLIGSDEFFAWCEKKGEDPNRYFI